MLPPREPTYEEIATHALVYETENEVGHACWYPQMSGYIAKCVVVMPKISQQIRDHNESPCFTAYVWHDGEFPFSSNSPIHLHHCSPEQFRRFADVVETIISGRKS